MVVLREYFTFPHLYLSVVNLLHNHNELNLGGFCMFILKKKVDWSFLTDGFNIPLEFQSLLHGCYSEYIQPGEKRVIKILIGTEFYEAKLININFSRATYPDHKDLLQVRYAKGSPLAQKLQEIFNESYQYLLVQRKLNQDSRKYRVMPEELSEYISFSSTDIPGTFMIDCYPAEDNRLLREDLTLISEAEYESETFELKEDANAQIVEMNRVQRVRKLNRSIANSLKALYDYRCQITGEKIGDKYNCHVIEAHHIEYFTKSLNNDTSNIIIVNPNFHRIIHQASPDFDRGRLAFIFPNGVVEKVRVNKHLK